MAKTLTIKQIEKGHNGKIRICFKQHSVKPYELCREAANQFRVGDQVILRNKKLHKN